MSEDDRSTLIKGRSDDWMTAHGSAQVELIGGMAKAVDASSSTTFYKGWADIGASTADAVWRIQRITISSGLFTFEWADGDASFDNIWDNRASLTYS